MAVKKYRVTGTQPVGGHAPGETFEADFPPEQEAPLLASRAIEVVVSQQKHGGGRKSGSKSDPSPS